MSIDNFIQDGQDPKVVEKIYYKIIDMLTSGESLSYVALQKKPAVTILPDSITVSNKRIFLCEFTKLGFATNFEIFSWADIKDIAFKEEIFGSKVTVIPYTGENLTIDYIPKVQARKLYQLIKEALENKDKIKGDVKSPTTSTFSTNPSQATEIKKVSFFDEDTDKKTAINERIADDDVRSENPKTVSSTHNPISYTTPEAPTVASPISKEEDDEITQKLKKLKTLYDKQLITQAEYESKKADLLDQL